MEAGVKISDSVEVKINVSELFSSHQPPRFSLTVFDRLMRHVPYQQRVLFYKSDPASSSEQIVALLKSSLAQVLTIFYPFAGRIQTRDDGSLELDCGAGQSVRFASAETNATLEQLGDFQPSEFCNSLCDLGPAPPSYPWSHDNPLLFIQVTRFSCGGLSLGFGFSHQAVDGVSAWQFMVSWAELARTGSLRVHPEIRYKFQEQQQIDAIRAALQSGALDFGHESELEDLPKSKEKLVTKQFKLAKQTIDKLKSEAAAGAADGTGFSTFVVVSAYFWRRITRARGLSESSDDESRFFFLVNCRERFDSLPKSYFGNAIALSHTSLKAGEQAGEIWKYARALRESIMAFNNQMAMSVVAFLDWKTGSSSGPLQGPQKLVQAIGSPRHPVYKTDFGFGRPAGVTFGTNDLGDGKLYLFPSPEEDGGVTVTVALSEDAMEELMKQDD